MKIALIVTDLTPPRMGGISKVSTELVKQYLKLGHRVSVFCLKRTADAFPMSEGLELIPVQSSWSVYKDYPVMTFSVKAFSELLKKHCHEPFDISHAMNFNNFGLTFYKSKMKNAGLAHVSTGFETTQMELRAKWKEFLSRPSFHCLLQIGMESFLAPWQRSYIGWADQITTEDLETRENFERMGFAREKMNEIPSGVDIKFLKEFNSDSPYLDSGRPIILCPGRVDSRKGTQFLIKAFSRLSREVPGARLVFAGGGRGDYILEMKKLSKRCGMEGKILITGQVEDLRPYYFHSDLVVIPSLSEGIPITLQEAMVFKKPVVCSKLKGTYGFAGHLKSVCWAQPGDPSDLEMQIKKVLGNEMTAEYLNESLAFISNYDWERVASSYLLVYQKAIDRLAEMSH